MCTISNEPGDAAQRSSYINMIHLRQYMTHFRTNELPLHCSILIILNAERRAPKILYFVSNLIASLGRYDQCVRNTRLVYATRSTCRHHYAYKEEYKTRQNQWVSILAPYNLISCAEMVIKAWHFVCNVRVDLIRNGML